MRRMIGVRMATMLLTGLVVVWAATQSAPGADNNPGAPAKTGKKTRASSNRLPRYFSKVVDKQQREKIYTIQNEYRPKIAAARKVLTDLLKQQSDKMLAVLTPEQQKQVQDAAASAKKKRSAAASSKRTAGQPAGSKPAAATAAK